MVRLLDDIGELNNLFHSEYGGPLKDAVMAVVDGTASAKHTECIARRTVLTLTEATNRFSSQQSTIPLWDKNYYRTGDSDVHYAFEVIDRIGRGVVKYCIGHLPHDTETRRLVSKIRVLVKIAGTWK